MKYILTLVCFAWFSAFAQEPAYTPMRLNYQFRGIKVDSLFLVPSFNDTTSANSSTMKNIAGSMIRTGNDFWMRNAVTTAWLQNVNVGSGASVSVQFVDSVYRKLGKDSIFWRKGGVEYKLKDSTGIPYEGDSPDRISGTATGPVNADMDGNILKFQNAAIEFNEVNGAELLLMFGGLEFRDSSGLSSFYFDKFTRIIGDSLILTGYNIKQTLKQNQYSLKDFNTTIITADTLGNITLGINNGKAHIEVSQADSVIKFNSAAPMTWKDKANALSSQVQTTYAKNNVDISGADYDIKLPGVYKVIDEGNDLNFPDPSLFAGQSFTIINNAGGAINIATPSGTIYDGKSQTLTTIADTYVYTFYSDGVDYYANNAY